MDRVARWLSYADSCIAPGTELARCQPLWNIVAILLGAVGLSAVGVAVVTLLKERRRKRNAPGSQLRASR